MCTKEDDGPERMLQKNMSFVMQRKKNWMIKDHWKILIFSDGCKVEFVNNNHVYVRHKSDEVVNPHFVSANEE